MAGIRVGEIACFVLASCRDEERHPHDHQGLQGYQEAGIIPVVEQGLQDGGDPDIAQQHPQKGVHRRVSVGGCAAEMVFGEWPICIR